MSDIIFESTESTITFEQVSSPLNFTVGYGHIGRSGHTIQNPAGVDQPERVGLQFAGDVIVTDDEVNNKTIVQVVGGGGGGSVAWGAITGILSNQLDLQAALDGKEDADPALQAHLTNTNNPHATNKAHVGLSAADNTSDLDKPVSNATAAALALKEDAIGPKGTAFNKNFGTLATEVMPGNTTFTYDQVGAAPITHVNDPTHLTTDERAGMTAAGPTGLNPLVAQNTLDAHTNDADIHVTAAQSAALDAANAPSGANPVATVNDLGTGSGHVIQDPAGTPLPDQPNLQFSGDVVVTDDAANNRTNVNVTAGAGAGEANTASNVGTGEGVWKDKIGVNLNFRSLLSSNGGLVIGGTVNEVTLAIQFAGTGVAATLARSDHDHNLTYLGISAKAADSELLDGLNSTAFASAAAFSTHIANQQHVPAGGTLTQVLGKASLTDLDTTWVEALQEAPLDSTLYSRQNGTWVVTPLSPVGGLFLNFNWSSNTTATDPGPGNVKCNNADPAAATLIYVDALTSAGNSSASVIESFQAGDYLGQWETGSDQAGLYYAVTGPVVDNTGWYTIPVTAIPGSSTGTIDDGSAIVVFQVNNEKNKLPIGGAVGQVLSKAGPEDYNTDWATQVSTYLELTDTENSYTGFGGYLAVVNPSENGIEFARQAPGALDYAMNFSTGIAPPVASGDVLINNANPSLATVGYSSEFDRHGDSLDVIFAALAVGDLFAVFDDKGRDGFIFLVDSNPVKTTDYWSFSIKYITSIGTVSNNSKVLMSVAFVPVKEFIDLLDTPNSYAGQAGKAATVNGTEDGMVFTAPGGAADLSNAVFPDSAHFTAQVVADATVAFTDSNKQTVNATTNPALTLSAPGVGSYILQITNAGSLTSITPTPKWDDGNAPAWGGTSILALYYDGTDWYGSAMVSAA